VVFFLTDLFSVYRVIVPNKEIAMLALFKLFPHSTLVTPLGDFEIEKVFPSQEAAVKEDYYHCLTYNGLDISYRLANDRIYFAVVGPYKPARPGTESIH
jgi:hypothetical protein